MSKRLGIVMDPIGSIHYKKDSTLAMLWEAARRHYELFYFELKDLYLQQNGTRGQARKLTVHQNAERWWEFQDSEDIALSDLNVILMRKDPPFNEEYIYATYLLEHAEQQGVTVVNKPQSLRDANEKLFAADFPECCPPFIVTQSLEKLHAFWQEHKDIVCKPLNSMGGTLVFRLKPDEVNANVIFDTLTHGGQVYVMAQQFIPAITAGDKRILLINGEPIPHVLARIPQGNDWRGNLAVGAKASIQPLTTRDRFICDQLAPALRKRGLYFVGIDVIGDYLTEINVTSPTGIREIDDAKQINVSAVLFDCIESLL